MYCCYLTKKIKFTFWCLVQISSTATSQKPFQYYYINLSKSAQHYFDIIISTSQIPELDFIVRTLYNIFCWKSASFTYLFHKVCI